MATDKKPENKRMIITKEQAIEIADKYLVYNEKYALKDNISVTDGVKGWEIVAITTPIISGMKTEIEKFDIDRETGEVGASISTIIIDYEIENALRPVSYTH